MLNTYIKNRGSTKTIVHTNNKNKVNEISWDADYDGENANISIDLNDNGNQTKHYDIQLDNKNLAEILNIPSVNIPLEKRLMLDFKKTRKNVYKQPMVIEFDMGNIDNMNNMDKPFSSPITRENILESMMVPYLASPLPNEEFLPKKTMRLYRKPRSYTRHKKHRTSSRRTTSSRPKSTSSSKRRSRRTL
jgi:hypothetical protein